MSYFEDGGTLPPPFNLFPTTKLLRCGRTKKSTKSSIVSVNWFTISNVDDIFMCAVMWLCVATWHTRCLLLLSLPCDTQKIKQKCSHIPETAITTNTQRQLIAYSDRVKHTSQIDKSPWFPNRNKYKWFVKSIRISIRCAFVRVVPHNRLDSLSPPSISLSPYKMLFIYFCFPFHPLAGAFCPRCARTCASLSF